MGRVTSCSQHCRQNFRCPQNEDLGLGASCHGKGGTGQGTGSTACARRQPRALPISCSLDLLEACMQQHSSSLVPVSSLFKVFT